MIIDFHCTVQHETDLLVSVPQAHWQTVMANTISLNNESKTILALGMTDLQIKQDSTPEEWRIWQEKVITHPVFDYHNFVPEYVDAWIDYHSRMASLKMPRHSLDFFLNVFGLAYYRYRYDIQFPGYEMIDGIKGTNLTHMIKKNGRCKLLSINNTIL